VKKATSSPKIANLLGKINECLDSGRYRLSDHAIERKNERQIDLLDAIHVLRTGYVEKEKDQFDPIFNTWKYAIRGKTLEDIDIRIILAFHEEEILFITIMKVTK